MGSKTQINLERLRDTLRTVLSIHENRAVAGSIPALATLG